MKTDVLQMMNRMREVHRHQVLDNYPAAILNGMWRKCFAAPSSPPYDGSLKQRRYWKKVTEIETAHAAGAVLADGGMGEKK